MPTELSYRVEPVGEEPAPRGVEFRKLHLHFARGTYHRLSELVKRCILASV